MSDGAKDTAVLDTSAASEPQATQCSAMSPVNPFLQFQQQAGNQALQSTFGPSPSLLQFPAAGAGNPNQCTSPPKEPAEPPPQPIVIHWNQYTPWFFTVDGRPSASAISMEIYGSDLTSFQPLVPLNVMGEELYVAEPALLRPVYRDRFEREMQNQLNEEVIKLKDLIFRDTDVDDGMTILARWASRGDLRLPSGRTYFDVFLARLRSDYWYRDYGLWEGAHHTYFDSLFDWAGSRAGEVSTLIAQNSREFGAFRPAWALVEGAMKPQAPAASPAGIPGAATPGKGPNINQELVTRSADLILDMLLGRTSKKDSKVIADTMIGLPPPEQAAVLNEIMGRYDETKWFGLVGKYGEANKVGMLYWFFEDMTGDDKERVQKSLVDNHVLRPEVAATLVSGRGIISRTLPWTTGKISEMAEERVEYWADQANQGSVMAYFWGSLDALFLQQNIDTTIETILLARVLPGVARLNPTLGKVLAVIGTGLTSYQVGIGLQQLLSGQEAYSGKEMTGGEKLANTLNLASNLIFLGAGFAEAGKPGGGRIGPTPIDEPGLLGAGPAEGAAKALPAAGGLPALGPGGGAPLAAVSGGGPGVEWRIVNINEQTGDLTAVGRSGNDYAIVRINGVTLEGELLHPSTGRVIPIRGGVPVESPPAMTGGTAAAADRPVLTGSDSQALTEGEPGASSKVPREQVSPPSPKPDAPTQTTEAQPKPAAQPDVTTETKPPATEGEGAEGTTKAPPNAETVKALEQQRTAKRQRIAELEEQITRHRSAKQDYFDRATRIEKQRATPDFREKAAKAKRQAQNEERLATQKEAEAKQLERENERIEKTINPPPKPVQQTGPGPGQLRGGAYNDIPTAGGEVNHIPPDSVSPLSTGKGPAIWMEKADHMLTKSWGSSRSAEAWREQQRILIRQGRFRDAVEMDIRDIREQFGNKYEKGIQEMLAYIDTLNPTDLRF